MNKHAVIAIDLAKNVFQVCILDNQGKKRVNKKLSRSKLVDFIAKQEATTIAMEACYSSHHWGRTFSALGHNIRLIPAQHVKPFVRGGGFNKKEVSGPLTPVYKSLAGSFKVSVTRFQGASASKSEPWAAL